MRRLREEIAAHTAATALRDEARARRAEAWRTAELTPERIRAEYDAQVAELAPDVREWARPVAAWVLGAGTPRADSSHMGGAPALYPDEDWPADDGWVMRFWAQINLAELAPYAAAYGIAMPADGLLQLFAHEEGGELARVIPAADLGRLELRREIPITSLWEDTEETREIFQATRTIDFLPEALIPWQEVPRLVDATSSEHLPGYCFGWWPFSEPDDADGLTFLAVCNSNRDLGLAFSDEGFLWVTVPTSDLAAGDFSRLHVDGESS
jgi:Domain of unknown function (DUF1963)